MCFLIEHAIDDACQKIINYISNLYPDVVKPGSLWIDCVDPSKEIDDIESQSAKYKDFIITNASRYIIFHKSKSSVFSDFESYEYKKHNSMSMTQSFVDRVNSFRTKTGMLENAEKLKNKKDRDYYKSVSEMFARGYESCLLEKMVQSGQDNTYLVSSFKKNELYPDSDHLKNLLPAFDRLNRSLAAMFEAMGVQSVEEIRSMPRREKNEPVMKSRSRRKLAA
jgi:hypothetical protein